MTNMTLSIPNELYKELKKHKELKWSEVAREAIVRKLEELKLVDQLLGKSTLTERDAERIGHGIKGRMRSRFEK